MRDPSTQTQQTYDEVAHTFMQKTWKTYPHLLDDIASLTADLRPGSVIADIGCGPGRDTALMRSQGFTVVGLDLSLGLLRAGGLSGVAQSDMRRLPLRTGSIDAVWCQAALLHIPHEAVSGVLAEFARVARFGSPLNLVVAEGDGQGWEPATVYGTQAPRWFTYHRESSLTDALATAGFRIRPVRHDRSGRGWLAIRAERITPSAGGEC